MDTEKLDIDELNLAVLIETSIRFCIICFDEARTSGWSYLMIRNNADKTQ